MAFDLSDKYWLLQKNEKKNEMGEQKCKNAAHLKF
jgi:hypothetical protein